jgi:hypothetical protein
METIKIHYKNNSSELCEIGKKYDTNKCSQRTNVTDYRHCHSYIYKLLNIIDNNKFYTFNQSNRIKGGGAI